jgi:hypothetical protein
MSAHYRTRGGLLIVVLLRDGVRLAILVVRRRSFRCIDSIDDAASI